MAIAMVVALLIAFGRILQPAVAHPGHDLCAGAARTPVLLQLFYLYYVLPFAGIRMEPWTAGIIGMSLAYSAYSPKSTAPGSKRRLRPDRGGAVDRHVGAEVMRVVLLPQAFRIIIIPPIGNIFIGCSGHSLLSILTIRELMFEGQVLAATTFQHITIFTVIAVSILPLLAKRGGDRSLRAAAQGRAAQSRKRPAPALAAVFLGLGGARMIRLEAVNKRFGHLHVLRDVNLDIARGEVVVVIGPSGSGKSTLLRVINHLRTSTAARSTSTASRSTRTRRTAAPSPTRSRSSAASVRASAWCRSASTFSRTWTSSTT